MNRIITLIGLLTLLTVSLLGCSSNTSSSSGFGSGSGYSLNFTTSNALVPEGGSVTLIVAGRDAQGNPVNDSVQGVTFSSTLGGTFAPTSGNCFLSSGVATTVFTAPGGTTTTPAAAVGVTQITASYKGAFAYTSISVYKP
jgi:hypothetical protein